MMSLVAGRFRALPALLVASLLVTTARSAPRQDTPPPPLSFEAFLGEVRADALARGIKPETIERAFSDLKPAPVVVKRDRSQPEAVQSLDAYLAQHLTKATIANARSMLARHRAVLDRVEAEYGVPREMIVAIWGLESNFGRFSGNYPIVQALATLAYDNRRSLFRDELLDALTMIDRGLVKPDVMKGSWAGAMGQPQFMPSSFLKHAVDFDGDGTIDIWRSPADVLASMANYFKNRGWTTGERWGREVTVSRSVQAVIDRQVPMRAAGCRASRTMTAMQPLEAWSALGVKLPGGRPLPTAALSASLVSGTKRAFLVYPNYDVIIDYNCSHAYAVAAGLLSDLIRQ